MNRCGRNPWIPLFLLGLCAIGAYLAPAWAAPAAKPKEQEITGTFDWFGVCPTVIVRDENGESRQHWLIFSNADREREFSDLRDGQKIKVTGRPAVGGCYFYFFAKTIERIP
jgi:hypothetical protein